MNSSTIGQNVFEGLSGGLIGIFGIIIAVLFFVVFIFLTKLAIYRRGKHVYIYKNGYFVLTRGVIKHNDISQETELSLYTTALDVIFNREPKIHVPPKALHTDVIYLIMYDADSYRYVDLKLNDELLELIYNDNEALAKEKFIKNNRYYMVRFQIPNVLKEVAVPIAAGLIIAFAIVFSFSILGDKMVEVSKISVDTTNRQMALTEKLANGTYLIESCKQLEAYKYQQLPMTQTSGNVVVTQR